MADSDIKRLEPRVWYRHDILDHELMILAEHENGAEAWAIALVLEPVARHGWVRPNRMTFGDLGRSCSVTHFLQALVDDCWRAGIRPTPEVADSAAKTAHLKDMQRLVFDVFAPMVKRND